MRRTVFPHRVLPWLLLAPQLAITVIFFFWPAGLAFRLSLLRDDPFGLTTTFVGLANFRRVLGDPNYLNALWVTVVFSTLVAFGALAIALFLAVQAEKIRRGRGLYRTLMIWPYAVAPAIAGMLWLFMFNPNFGTLSVRCLLAGNSIDALADVSRARARTKIVAVAAALAAATCSARRAAVRACSSRAAA